MAHEHKVKIEDVATEGGSPAEGRKTELASSCLHGWRTVKVLAVEVFGLPTVGFSPRAIIEHSWQPWALTR